MAYDEPWKLSEDGYLNVDTDSDSIIYHPNLNIILVSTKSSEVHVIDVNSGVILQKSSLSGCKNGVVRGTYLVGHDKILFTDGRGIGVRRDYNGVMLLDTILQTPMSKSDDIVKLELLLSEAILLQQCLKCVDLPGVENIGDIQQELAKKIKGGQEKPKTGTKAQKWNSICLEVTHSALKLVCSGMVQELKRQNRPIPALSIASAINERLGCLLPACSTESIPAERSQMFSEAARIDTFVKWPHMHYKWALPDQMAQAGFYHQPNATGDDRAMCFTCNVCLVCWEPTDEPWSEHERHSPSCPFVKGEYTQNVPLSASYATAPAVAFGDHGQRVSCIGASSVSDLVATASHEGLVVVWNVARQLKKDVSFVVSPAEIARCVSESKHREVWPRGWSHVTPPCDAGGLPAGGRDQLSDTSEPLASLAMLSALAVVGGPCHAGKRAVPGLPRPCVVVGLTAPGGELTAPELAWGGGCSPMVRAMNDVNEASNRQSAALDIMSVSAEKKEKGKETGGKASPDNSALYLAVFDFHYASSNDNDGQQPASGRSAGKQKSVSGTGTSASTAGTRHESNNMYQEIFLSKFLCDVPIIQDVDTDVVMHAGHQDCLDVIDFGPMPSSSLGNYPSPFGVAAGSGGGTFDASTVSVSFSALNGGADFTTDCPPPGVKAAASSATGKEAGCTKRAEPCVVQCLALPEAYRERPDLAVLGLHPTKDGRHLLVVLGPPFDQPDQADQADQPDQPDRMEVDGEPAEGLAVLLVYSLELSGQVVRLAEAPLSVRELPASECPLDVILLPLGEREGEEAASPPAAAPPFRGHAALVCRDGVVRVVDLTFLITESQATPPPEGGKFVSAAFCNSLERLCACTDKGSLHFFVLSANSSRVARSDEAGSNAEWVTCDTPDFSSTPSASAAHSPTGSVSATDMELLVNRPVLTLPDLLSLHELTRHENLSPLFSAAVPPCWTEMMQAQKQRRHPQHLQQGEEPQNTRSWRLQNDATTWDEHMFEITLPRSCSVGHLDIKFSLHSPCPSPPNVQVTLLKQNANGIGRKEPFASSSVDQHVEFNLAGSFQAGQSPSTQDNPVTTQEYLRDHNTEILCGPINLSSCLDLSDQGGSMTLTSPKLFSVRGRTLLVHMKAISEEGDHAQPSSSKAAAAAGRMHAEEKGSASKKSKLDSLFSMPMLDRQCANANAGTAKKMEFYLGCDWLHEISITIRKTKQTSIPHDRVQRWVLLESDAVAERLLWAACSAQGAAAAQGVALDILVWVASVRLTRHRSARPEVHVQQLAFARLIEKHLGLLVERCLLLAGRSIAHKCVKLIVICSEGVKNVTDSVTVQFDACVLRALLDWLPHVLRIRSAGALRWFFLLLGRVMALDVSASAGQKCLKLLQQVAQELSLRSSPYHLLLRTRFGLYGTPLEPELFDVDPPASAKASSVPVTYATVASSNETPAGVSVCPVGPGLPDSIGASEQAEGLDLRELLALPVGLAGLAGVMKGIPTRLRGLSSGHYMKGLLEVEPLHFTCHAASDGTKMEKVEAGAAFPPNASGNVTVGNFFDPNSFVTTSAGTKIGTDGSFADFQALKALVKSQKAKSKSSTVMVDQDKAKHSDTSSSSSSQQSTVSGPAMFGSSLPADPPGPPPGPPPGLDEEEAGKLPEQTKLGDTSWPLPWQQLLVAQPQHMLVIERMHSGARRFVVMDLGGPVLLTDLIIPSCSDLVSLSVDIWTRGEELDGQRLVVASDIGTKSLIMSDLQPPPICRYIKITTIGRYGMSTTRCRIPVGSFFGHLVVLPGESYDAGAGGQATALDGQLAVLASLLEDVHCRYSLACAKLRELLAPLLAEEIPNVAHMHHFLQRTAHRSDSEQSHVAPASDGQRVLSAYQECVTFQRQLNLVRGVMRRLQSIVVSVPTSASADPVEPGDMLRCACTDKLRVLGEGLLDMLLYLAYEIGPVPRLPVSLYQTFDQPTCGRLFGWLCVGEDTRMQLGACSLLVRMCGMQPWWGDFLANSLTTFYASRSHSADIFPQDRVFLLLTYLGRKSLAGGAPRAVVMDSTLATLARLLLPLAQQRTGFLRAEMDLSLIGWLLLFLSICLDTNQPGSMGAAEDVDKPKDSAGFLSRWDFIQGEVAMQKRLATTNRSNASRSYRRKLQKRLMHHKQQLEDLEAAKKAFHASTQALSALSSQAASLSSKLEAALKQHEQVFKKTLKQHSAKHFKDILQIRRTEGPSLAGCKASNGAGSARPSPGPREESVTEATLVCLPVEHCLPVARGLIALILRMDFTCNIDMFLLACKVIARIVVSTRPAISLGQLLSQDQLLHLVRLAVWSDQHKGSWGGPWAAHAICCLLQDILEGARSFPPAGLNADMGLSEPGGEVGTDADNDGSNEAMNEPRTPPGTPPEPDETTPLVGEEQDYPTPSEAASNAKKNNANNNNTNNNGNNNFHLQSLLESEDSELEDFLDDILERGRNLLKRGNSSRVVVTASSSISTALDARLEFGVEASAEVVLKRLTALGAYNLPLSVAAAVLPLPESARQPFEASWEAELLASASLSDLPSHSYPHPHHMLATTFDKLLSTHNTWTNLELVLQLWLTLNADPSSEAGFDACAVPSIALGAPAAAGLLSALAWHPGISLRAWTLAFQCLTLLVNSKHGEMARTIVHDAHLVPALQRFLSGTGLNAATKGSAGPSVCQSLHDFLVRLLARCDVVSVDSEDGNALKKSLLRLVFLLVTPSGALPARQGPLDAQCKLADLLLRLDFAPLGPKPVLGLVDSVAGLVYTYILSLDRVRCRSISESGVTPSACFGGLFASVLGGEAKQGKPATWDALICSLLKLMTRLVQTPLPVADKSMDVDVQVARVADLVLKNKPTMQRLLSALAECSGSTLAMLMGSAPLPEQGQSMLAVGELGEPVSVGDAVFQLLSTLARQASKPALVLQPLLRCISASGGAGPVGVMQLSEPLLWLVLRIVNSESALQHFNALGGVAVVCENLVRSNVALINAHPSLVSVVMQHLSLSAGCSASPPAGGGKRVGGVETYEGLLNFAPLGTITSSNPTAQPADVLIASAPPHRRARTPAWSYHFYPDEAWVELSIALPCAVLLKEVQLQPHLTSLATCPSAVALEVSRDATMAPVCGPLDTSGLTFVRLTLPQPEVVTSVLLRLYKPRDSANIGLSQVRLLGSTTFGETAFRSVNADVPDEELLTKSSLGWLRLLHHCLCLPRLGTQLSQEVLDATAGVPRLLEACCGLLLIPAPSPLLFTPSLERVLLRLGLHSRELGLAQINTLLRNGAAAFGQGSLQPAGQASAAVDSVVELVYQLCTAQDEATQDRVGALLAWLHETATTALQSPSAAYVHAAAAILWAGHAEGVAYDLASMVTQPLFAVLCDWALALPAHAALKKAVDTVLCSMCCLDVSLFQRLLRPMGSFAEVDSQWRITSLYQPNLTESRLMTVAMACQSARAVDQLIASGLPSLLTAGILEFCERQAASEPSDANAILPPDSLALVLDFFAEVCPEGCVRDWLGSAEGSVFWLPLLSLLCNKSAGHQSSDAPSSSSNTVKNEAFTALESSTIKFLSRCCWCHPGNQVLLSQVLCDVIRQQKTEVASVTYLHGISGFTRRLVLQLLLENEKLLVYVKANFPLARNSLAISSGCSNHPSYGVGHQRQLMYLSTQTTCADILKHVSASGCLLPMLASGETAEPQDPAKKELWEIGLGLVDQLALAAGATAKDKRAKDAKNAGTSATSMRSTPYAKRARGAGTSAQDQCTPTSNGGFSLGLSLPQPMLALASLPNVPLPGGVAIGQLLRLEEERGRSLSSPRLELILVSDVPKPSPATASKDESASKQANTQGNKMQASAFLATPLQVFSDAGGLALLAQHLPLVYPETLRYSSTDKACGTGGSPLDAGSGVDTEWVKVEAAEDMYEDLDDSMPAGTSSPGGSRGASPPSPSVPPHSLAAFGLFLRLPGYADVLLCDRKKAQCLLRLVLGVTDDGQGADIFSLPVASSLHTLPFHVLRQLFDSTPVASDQGRLLRETTVDIGAIHLLLGCLSVFTHQQQDIQLPAPPLEVVTPATKATMSERGAVKPGDDKVHLYWAKGTGFGTGSTAQSWNVEQALMRQRSEEEHVTVLVQVLSCFINPGNAAPANFYSEDEDSEDDEACGLPASFPELLEQSCLLPAISSYLRNDSVLDMARHIPLYRALLQLLRAMAYNSSLASLLLPPDSKAKRTWRADELSVVCLLTKMKGCVDTYASRLKLNKTKGASKSRLPAKFTEELESDEGLAFFIFDIQETANLVQLSTERLVLEDEPDGEIAHTAIESPLGRSLEERYLEVMKRLQFDSFEMITECAEGGGFQFVVAYHFEANMRAAGDRCHPSRVKRLAQETVTLSTSLPLSYSSSVFVRCDTDRLDIMKVLITGPAETPYANGCFEFDVYFPPEYPNAPMMINLETTGHHTIRFNPNLYNDGKVCLSVLNTWHGRPEEKWNAATSSFLQVLVSIQSLILVPEPYFNEPGYERSRGTPSGNQSSREYNSNICQATVKWAMLEQVRNPCPCFKEMIHTHFWMKRKEIVAQVEGWIADMEAQCGDRRTGRAISLNAMALKRHFRQLRDELAKLKTPEGLSDLIDPILDMAVPSTLNSPDSKDASPTASQASAEKEGGGFVVANHEAHGVDQDIDLDIDMEMEKMVSKVCE